MENVICYTRGVAEGNPRRGAIGVYITDGAGAMMREEAMTIGNSTPEFAEYNAVLVGLQTLQAMLGTQSKTTVIELRLQSALVKQQLNAESPINEPGFVPMFIEIHNMRVASFPHLTFALVTPEENVDTERLAHEALKGT